ncbi:MXAN_5808 family serine peptidase [Vulgatibacter sp.]|uniref:MXAN_5808 family serine peptidase n=1 Tax=Vulgatibacter sp. TaxID=1971226 RepID=UPI00356A48D0
MIRIAARAAALVALVGAWSLAAGNRLVPVLSEARAASPASQEEGSHDLASLKIFNRVVLLVKENYFDPSRISPQQMLVDALDSVEKEIPEVMVDGDVKTGAVKVTVGGKTASFSVTDVDSIFKMSLRLGQVMGFVQKNLDAGHPEEDLRNIEYALVNGMLSSLDPHSVLLKPEYFKEMRLNTKGEFGGLGFVISMREGELTVVKVLKGTAENPTPAFTYGIKPKDRILRIGDESTVNMDLSEAVERLRGKPGSKIDIMVARKGWKEPRVMSIPRAIIEIESVVHKLLSSNVGYVRIKNFQGNTARDVQNAVKAMRAEAGGKIKGLVLDLRGNPGGLLEQAIQVSDLFVDEGSIVTTVGMSNKLREVKRATDSGDALEKTLPIAVLVNGGSASASEIVSGALKNLDRAVVIGRTTFGKGSVQVLYDFPDLSALKLTIAQYLTPGDVSIQETGVTPDIELVPSRVDKKEVNLFAPVKTMREADLDAHLANPADGAEKIAKKSSPDEKPLLSLRYLRDDVKLDEDEAALEDEEALEEELSEEFVEDFQIRFARDFVLSVPSSTRSGQLKAMGDFVAKRAAVEEKRMEKAIVDLGVDWSAAAATVTPASAVKGGPLEATLTPGPATPIRAGEKVQMQLQVKNTGKAPLAQLRAWTESESNPYLDRREFLIGALAPGQQKSWSVEVELPKDLASRRDAVVVKFEDASGEKLQELHAELDIVEVPKPRFAFTWQVIDKEGDGDGMPDPGEKLTLALDVKNVGPGASSDVTYASIKNKGNEKIFIEKGRHKLGELAPGALGNGHFEFELKKGYAEKTVPLQLLVFDEKLEEIVVEQLEIPVDGAQLAAQPAKGLFRVAKDGFVRAAPNSDSPTLARIQKGAVLPVEARVGPWARVEWNKGRIGYVQLEAEEKLATRGKAAFAGVESRMWRNPPRISLDVDTSKGGVAVDDDHYQLGGTVEDPELRDVFVFVNDQKVFFAPGGGADGKLRFDARFPLKEGANHVVVVAREGNELTSRRAFTVLRRKGEIAAKSDAGGKTQKATPIR